MLKKYPIILALAIIALGSDSLVFAAEVSISQIQAQFNHTKVNYSFLSSYPRSMKESPPVATWTSNLPCGSLVNPTKNTVEWDMADGTQLPKCPFKKNGIAITQDGIIYLGVKASNGEEYNCTYEKGSRTGLGGTCGTGPVTLTTQERIQVKTEDDSIPSPAGSGNAPTPGTPGKSSGSGGGLIGGLLLLVAAGFVVKKKFPKTWEKLTDGVLKIFNKPKSELINEHAPKKEDPKKDEPKDEKKKRNCDKELSDLKSAKEHFKKVRDAREEIWNLWEKCKPFYFGSLDVPECAAYKAAGARGERNKRNNDYREVLRTLNRAEEAYMACTGVPEMLTPYEPKNTPEEEREPGCEKELKQLNEARKKLNEAKDALDKIMSAWEAYKPLWQEGRGGSTPEQEAYFKVSGGGGKVSRGRANRAYREALEELHEAENIYHTCKTASKR